jgi:hypothetical protein
MILVRILLKGSLNFGELMVAAEGAGVGRDSVHAALRELGRCGYVSDDADATKKRKPNATRFTADRVLITGDFAAFMEFTLG